MWEAENLHQYIMENKETLKREKKAAKTILR
jgi:hypothetical protein